jgi:hypothetical protein
VYIPDKRDKQGRRFGFVKYRDIVDAREQLDLISNIWVGSFRLRVNLSRFAKYSPRKEVTEKVAEVGKGKTGARVEVGSAVRGGRTFKEMVAKGPTGVNHGKKPVVQKEDDVGSSEVVWEVEVEPTALVKLKGAYVGFLSEAKDHLDIQRNFTMDGYPNIRVAPLGYLKVLITSSVEGEVQGVVGVVGWWCTLFERFEEWSPNWVSNQRTTWLCCFGVPLHAWGTALFRMVGFKFGRFIDTDLDTKNMSRVDVAKIRIATNSPVVIDSVISVLVLGKKFVIRVVEDVGGVEERSFSCSGNEVHNLNDRSCNDSNEEGSLVAMDVQGSVEEGDSDWSESRQGVLGDACQESGKGEDGLLLSNEGQKDLVSGSAPIFLGNFSGGELIEVNDSVVEKVDVSLEFGRAIVMVQQETDRRLEGVLLGDGHVSNALVPLQSVGPECCNHVVGPMTLQPKTLRTKKGDIVLSSNKGGGTCNASESTKICTLGPGLRSPTFSLPVPKSRGPNGIISQSNNHSDSFSSIPIETKRDRTKSVSKKQFPFPPGNFLYKFHEATKAGHKAKRKKRGIHLHQPVDSNSSDPIEVSEEVCQRNYYSDLGGIELEVVLPSSGGGEKARSESELPLPIVSSVCSGNSGLAGVLGVSLPLQSEVPFSGGLVEKARGDAYHIIDIQEDVGMNFHGQGDEDVDRGMRLEGRDRALKHDWVQSVGHQ